MITDPQIGPRDPQIVTVQIRPADPPRSVFCRVPLIIDILPVSQQQQRTGAYSLKLPNSDFCLTFVHYVDKSDLRQDNIKADN